MNFESTTAEFVDSLDGVYRMLEQLKKAPAIAIDLEHHDTHSYVGIVSLMQISTREHDWLIDTLKPWRHRLEILNEVFTDSNILKVGVELTLTNLELNDVGSSWRSHGYLVASERFWSLYCWPI